MKLHVQILRFGLVGAANTIVAYGLFSVLLWAGVHYTLATFLGGVAGMLLGFKLTGALVFGSRDNGRILRFMVVFLLQYLVNVGAQAALRIAVNPYLAGALATMFCFFPSFAMNRSFVFRVPRSPRD